MTPTLFASDALVPLTLILIIAAIAFFFFCLPALVALLRGHPNAGAIIVLLLLFGWTLVGWAVALIWSFTAFDDRRR